jgi:hypothetical protein
MLFDLRGKRRHVVQVSFAMLALLFLVGFLGFGIGVGGGPGGIFDALGISNSSNSSGSANAVYQDHIDKANAKLAKNPKDTQALLTVANNEYLLGKSGVSQDQTTGQFTVTNDAHTNLGDAADAWSKYLKLNKGNPDLNTAYNMVNVYVILNDGPGAIKTQTAIAQAKPSQQSYGQLAFFQYLTGDISGGDQSKDKAISLAPKSQQKQLETQLSQARKQGLQVQKQQQQAKRQAKQQGGGSTTTPNPLQNPFGGVGATPSPTPTPTP